MKEQLNNMEAELEVLCTSRRLKEPESKAKWDAFYGELIRIINKINNLPDDTALIPDAEYANTPLNFNERNQFILDSAYTYMAFQQMKMMKEELFKKKAIYDIKNKKK